MFKRNLTIAVMMCIFAQVGICGNKLMYDPARIVLGDKYETVASGYDRIYDFNEGYAGVQKNGLMGFIDINGKECIPVKYYAIGSYSDGLIAVKETKDSKAGYMNLKEKWSLSRSLSRYMISIKE